MSEARTRRSVVLGGAAGLAGSAAALAGAERAAATDPPIDDRYVLRERVAVNVKDWGTGDATGWRSAIQNAMDAVFDAKGGTVFLPAGTYVLDEGGPLRIRRTSASGSDELSVHRGLRVVGEGIGATVIKLGPSSPRAFDFLKVADDDTFQNIEIADLTVDCNNQEGTNHTVIGNLQAGAFQSRINIKGLAVRRVQTMRVPTNPDGSYNRRSVSIFVSQADDTGPRNVVEDVLVEDCDFRGGAYGASVGGTTTSATKSTNVRYDRIRFVRTFHDTQAAYTADRSSANFFIGSAGFGGSCHIVDCEGRRSGDVGVEIDGATYAVVRGTVIEDAFDAAFFCRNFRAAEDPGAQKIVFRDCHARVKTLNPSSGVPRSPGFTIGYPGTSPPLGEVILDGCSWYSAASNLSAGGAAINMNNHPVKRVVVRDFRGVADKVAYSSGSSNFPSHVLLLSSAPEAQILVDGAYLEASGTFSGGGTLAWRGIAVSGAAGGTASFAIENVDLKFAIDNPSGTSLGVLVGLTPVSTMRGLLRRVNVVSWTTGASSQAISVQGTSVLTIDGAIRVEECDFRKLPSGSGHTPEVACTGDPTNRPGVYERGNTYRSWPAQPAPVTLDAPPQSILRNLNGSRQDYVVSGGTGVSLWRSRDNIAWTALGVSQGTVSLDHGDYLKLLYTTPPTVTRFPAG